MRKIILALSAIMLMSCVLSAQNVQLHRDWGRNIYTGSDKNLESRAPLTTTVEMYKPDSWGSTFFFVDLDYLSDDKGVGGAYWEISRELQFWKAPVSIHVEYNGGLNSDSGSFNNSYLFGLTYSLASKDFSKTLTISAIYKSISYAPKDANNFLFTAVWNVWFARKALLFSGFVDFWRENRPWQGTSHILLSEPQIWYNFNTIEGWEKINLSVGGEVEISNNFAGKGFYAIPTTALKWTF